MFLRVESGPQFSLYAGSGETLYHLGTFWSKTAAFVAGRSCGFTNWQVRKDGLTTLKEA